MIDIRVNYSNREIKLTAGDQDEYISTLIVTNEFENTAKKVFMAVSNTITVGDYSGIHPFKLYINGVEWVCKHKTHARFFMLEDGFDAYWKECLKCSDSL